MVFKLVQIDSENCFKIQLELGIHIFGRGKFLNINDKRISRQHGQFEVTDDSLIITAFHQNPCFFRKNGTTQIQTLNQSEAVTLTNGDKLGLLQHSYWYEVLQCTPVDNEEGKKTQEECVETTRQEKKIESGEETDNDGECIIHSNTGVNVGPEEGNIDSQSTQVLSPSELEQETSNDVNLDKGIHDSQTGSTVEKACVRSELTTDNDLNETPSDEPMSTSLTSADQETKDKSPETEPSSSDQCSPQRKRPHTDTDEQSDDVKRIKIEPESKPDVKSESSSRQAGSSNSNNVGANPPQAAPVQLRERCMYGAGCYRRNPVHRAQFSHPHDADWGTGDKAPCPWGMACGKRDPRHWRDHDHPPGKDQPPPPPQPGVRVVHRQGNVFYINAHSVNFYDDHFEAEDSDGNSVDYDYEF